jgi:hypothetical protein
MPCRTGRQRLEPELDEPEPEAPAPDEPAPDAPEPEEPEAPLPPVLPELPDVPAPLAPPLSLLAPVPDALPEAPPQSFCAHLASLGFRLAHADLLLAFDLPEFVAEPAEFICEPEELSAVLVDDFVDEVLLLEPLDMLSVLLPLDGLLFAEPVVPLYEPPVEPVELDDPFIEDEPVPLIEEPLLLLSLELLPVLPEEYELPVLPEVEPVVPVVDDDGAVCVAVVLSLDFLCFMSPIARAEPLASAMMDVRTNAGASLRILPPMCVAVDWWWLLAKKLAASRMPRIDALQRG